MSYINTRRRVIPEMHPVPVVRGRVHRSPIQKPNGAPLHRTPAPTVHVLRLAPIPPLSSPSAGGGK